MKLANGVPQGGVISPLLFNLFMNDLPDNKEKSALLLTYADDITIAIKNGKWKTARRRLQSWINKIQTWLETNLLKVSPPKSSVTLLTPDRHESKVHPKIILQKEELPLNKTPKILGVTYDTHMTFTNHIQNIKKIATRKTNTTKALAGFKFGQRKESMAIIYKQFTRTSINYSNPAWFPTISDCPTNLTTLQTLQNNALRVITGNTKSSNIHHLHRESKIIPIKQHLKMQGCNFMNRTKEESHPSHHLNNSINQGRDMKTAPNPYYNKLIDNLPPKPPNITQTKHHHTEFTKEAINSYDTNPLLKMKPPEIHESEKELTRQQRTSLSRLRSKHHQSLQNFKFKINKVNTPICQKCHQEVEEDVEHMLLKCTKHNTERNTHNIHSLTQLWTEPTLITQFLKAIAFC